MDPAAFVPHADPAEAAAAAKRISVKVSLAEIRRGNTPLPLSKRERELVTALAFRTHPCPVQTLAGVVYPDLSDADARNNVKVYICRLRQRVAPDFILWADNGYAFGPQVEVDLAGAQQLVARITNGEPLFPAEREPALSIARDLRGEAPEWIAARDWFAALNGSPQRLGRELALLVGREALERDEARVAARVGRELTYEDPCDEEAWELLIRAQLRSGEPAAALQGFRFYTVTLAREMQAVPSANLRNLVSEALGNAYLAS
jgi:DNA-binding SARP family transcriptional activator